jgi:hypothetical protein
LKPEISNFFICMCLRQPFLVHLPNVANEPIRDGWTNIRDDMLPNLYCHRWYGKHTNARAVKQVFKYHRRCFAKNWKYLRTCPDIRPLGG